MQDDAARVDDMPLLDPRRLLVFAEVARRGSLAAAAASLGWTQPAIAQHVKHLERDAGCALVVRTARGTHLTEAGRALAEHADAIVARLRAAREDLDALAELRAGRVRVAAFPSAAATFVPAAIARLRMRAPDIDVRLTEAEPPEARQLLSARDVDLAVTFGYDDLPDQDFRRNRSRRLADDPMLLVVPAGHRFAERDAVDLAEAADERWVAGCVRCRAHLVAAAGARGFAPDIRHSTDDYVVTQTLVATGLGLALLPGLALAASRDRRISAVPLADHPPRRIELRTPLDLPLSAAGRALVDELVSATAARSGGPCSIGIHESASG